MSYIREEIRRAKIDAQRVIERTKLRISPKATEGQVELVKRLRTKIRNLKATQMQTKPRRKRRRR